MKLRRSRRVTALGDGALRFQLRKTQRKSEYYDEIDDDTTSLINL